MNVHHATILQSKINQSSWLFKNRCSVIFPAGREVKICSGLCCGSCAEIISEKIATWKVECPRTTNWIFSGIFYLMTELINSFTDRYLVYNIWRSLDNMTTAKFKNADRGRKWNKKINILYLKSRDLFLSANLAANRVCFGWTLSNRNWRSCLAVCNSDFELNLGIKRCKPSLTISIILAIETWCKLAGSVINHFSEEQIPLVPAKDLIKVSRIKMLNCATSLQFAPYVAIGLTEQ